MSINFHEVREFKNGFAAVNYHGTWGFVDVNYEPLTELKYCEVSDFNGDYAICHIRKDWEQELGEKILVGSESVIIDKSGIEYFHDYYDFIHQCNGMGHLFSVQISVENIIPSRDYLSPDYSEMVPLHYLINVRTMQKKSHRGIMFREEHYGRRFSCHDTSRCFEIRDKDDQLLFTLKGESVVTFRLLDEVKCVLIQLTRKYPIGDDEYATYYQWCLYDLSGKLLHIWEEVKS